MAVVAGRTVSVVVGELREPADRGAVLLRPDEHDAGHPHLHVLDVLEVAVPHVRAFSVRPVEVGELLPDRHRNGDLRHPVVQRRRDVEAVPVDGVRVGQVGTLDQPEVGQRDLHVVVLDEVQGRRGHLGVSLVRGDEVGHGLVGIGRHVAEPEDVQRVILPARHRGVPVGGHERERLGRRRRGTHAASQPADHPAGDHGPHNAYPGGLEKVPAARGTLIRPDDAAMAMVHPDLLGGTRQRLAVSYWSGGVSATCVPGSSSAPRSHGVRVLRVRCCGRYWPS